MSAAPPAAAATGPPPAVRARQRAAAAVAALALAALAVTLPTAPPTARRAAADCPRLRVDPNTATAAELALLPDLGPVRAARIVDYRDGLATRPAFRGPDDLQTVTGIGPVIANRLRPHLTFPPPPADTGAAP